ncbi:MAG: DUF1697 domain-containing protein [bacterium]|nr:DUF1697 domain-containing protein [bacterium]
MRGNMPSNPNMRNEKLRQVFETEGFTNVQTVISSGNVIFTSLIKDVAKIETRSEKALEKNLGIKGCTIIRSLKELETIIKKDPFNGKPHSNTSYLIVTFLKKKPYEIYTVVDLSKSGTPDFMKIAEKEYGKEITTRTWKTVQRIITKMEK